MTGMSMSDHGPAPTAVTDPHEPARAGAGPAGDPVVLGGVRVRISRAGPGVVVVGVAGELDIATAHVLASALADAVSAAGDGRIVLELGGVTLLAAHGLSVVLAAQEHARRHGAEVVLSAGHDAPAARVLRLLPVGCPLPVHTSVTAALGGSDDV